MNRMKNVLEKYYSPDEFRRNGHQAIDMLAGQLERSQSEEPGQTITWLPPEEQYQFWKEDFESGEELELSGLLKEVSDHSIQFHNKGYMGHQVAVTLPITALTSAAMGYLNNCTTVYELGMAGNAMEKVVIGHLAEKFGYGKQAVGFVTSGGSMGNLTALVTARTSPGLRKRIIIGWLSWFPVKRITAWSGRPRSWGSAARIS